MPSYAQLYPIGGVSVCVVVLLIGIYYFYADSHPVLYQTSALIISRYRTNAVVAGYTNSSNNYE